MAQDLPIHGQHRHGARIGVRPDLEATTESLDLTGQELIFLRVCWGRSATG